MSNNNYPEPDEYGFDEEYYQHIQQQDAEHAYHKQMEDEMEPEIIKATVIFPPDKTFEVNGKQRQKLKVTLPNGSETTVWGDNGEFEGVAKNDTVNLKVNRKGNNVYYTYMKPSAQSVSQGDLPEVIEEFVSNMAHLIHAAEARGVRLTNMEAISILQMLKL